MYCVEPRGEGWISDAAKYLPLKFVKTKLPRNPRWQKCLRCASVKFGPLTEERTHWKFSVGQGRVFLSVLIISSIFYSFLKILQKNFRCVRTLSCDPLPCSPSHTFVLPRNRKKNDNISQRYMTIWPKNNINNQIWQLYNIKYTIYVQKLNTALPFQTRKYTPR